MTGTEVTNYDKQWAAEAQQKSEKERVSSSTITHRGGVFKCGDMEFKELCVIILADVYENSYYPGAFDSDSVVPPKCYAFAKEEETLSPHPSMQTNDYFEPQNHDCVSCPLNQWGSADTGRGKACKNTRRMAVIPAGVYSPQKGTRDLALDLYIDPANPEQNAEHILHSEAMMIKVPPTSVREFQTFVQHCSAEHNRPPAGVIARIYTEPMDNGGHKLVFEPVELLPDDLYPAVSARGVAAAENLFTPYNGPEEAHGGERPSDDTAPRKRLGAFRKRS